LPDTQPLAENVGRAIAKSKLQSVVVLDFAGPERKFTGLGRTLTDKFSADLAKSSDRFSVTERGRSAESLANKGLNTSNVRDLDFASWIASELGAESVVFGTLALSGDSLNIEVGCYSVKTGKRIDGIKTASSISDEMRKLMSQTVDLSIPDSYSGVPTPGKNGYSYPKCDYCPPAAYTSQAAKNHIQGTVILTVVVGTDGRAGGIVVKKPLPDGLTDSAIAAVKSWKFSPALGPDGKPAAVRQVIEVTFHL